MTKFNFEKTIGKIHSSLKKGDRQLNQIGLGKTLESVSKDPEDYVVLPEWWEANYGIPGLKFGHFTQAAGSPDSAKTTLALLSIRCAQEQGYGVIYVETEGKTSTEDLIAAGIDPKGVICIYSKITEEVFSGVNTTVDAFFDDYPDEKLLVVIDSLGNTVSARDSELDFRSKTGLVGGAAKMNRMGLNSLAAKQVNFPIAVLVINYTYDNIGSHGKTNAGGQALNYFSMLIIQTARKAWLEKQRDGQKVRVGAQVKWQVYKNHYAKALRDENGDQVLLPKELILNVTDAGLRPA